MCIRFGSLLSLKSFQPSHHITSITETLPPLCAFSHTPSTFKLCVSSVLFKFARLKHLALCLQGYHFVPFVAVPLSLCLLSLCLCAFCCFQGPINRLHHPSTLILSI
mmetsp:Transcript_15515/g.18681  ORF Transcript_15515/g.18681 Transcript_15515/m.18681 type:complete len:107 (-) Transcript_15515:910-1230(-)